MQPFFVAIMVVTDFLIGLAVRLDCKRLMWRGHVRIWCRDLSKRRMG